MCDICIKSFFTLTPAPFRLSSRIIVNLLTACALLEEPIEKWHPKQMPKRNRCKMQGWWKSIASLRLAAVPFAIDLTSAETCRKHAENSNQPAACTMPSCCIAHAHKISGEREETGTRCKNSSESMQKK